MVSTDQSSGGLSPSTTTERPSQTDEDKRREFFRAVLIGEPTAVAELLEGNRWLAGARSDAGLSAVIAAAYWKRWAVLRVILEADPPLDAVECAAIGNVDVLSAILDADQDAANAWGPDGSSALHLAAYFNQPGAARALIAGGADVRATSATYNGIQPLHSAVAGRSVEVARLLIEAGAPTDTRQLGGWTPLMEAVAAGDEDMVRLLMASGADPAIARSDGVTALDIGVRSRSPAIVALLHSRPRGTT